MYLCAVCLRVGLLLPQLEFFHMRVPRHTRVRTCARAHTAPCGVARDMRCVAGIGAPRGSNPDAPAHPSVCPLGILPCPTG